MFSTREYLNKKTGPYGIGRCSYLQSLVTEFQDTDSEEAKEQVLCNLANFAYDPINFEYLRQLNIMELFLDCLTESNENMVEFAIGGLCSLALDKDNKEYILENEGVSLIMKCLSSSREETVLSAITTLMYLVTPRSKPDITSPCIIEAMMRFTKSSNTRLTNLAQIFLEDYCSEAQIEHAASAQRQWQAHVEEGARKVTASATTSVSASGSSSNG